MMANSSAPVTSILFFDTDTQPLAASVISANPSQTAYLLNCPPGTDSNDCGTFNETITVGPWAAATNAAATGVYDVYIDMPGESFTFSIHCAMTSTTVPAVCTTINLGGNDDDGPTATYTSPATDDSILGWAYMPVTITAGAEKLASFTTTATSTDASSTSATTGSSATFAISGSTGSTGSTESSATSTTSVSATASAATASASSGAATGLYAGMGNVGLVGLALAWLLR